MVQPSVDASGKIELLKPIEAKKPEAGVSFPRYFTARMEPGKTPCDDVRWETRTASITNDKGAVIFEQRDVVVPVEWSQTATNIVASKYFYGKAGSPEREHSVAQLVEPGGKHYRAVGPQGRLLPDARGRREFPPRAGPPDAHPEGLLQLPGVV